MAAECGGHIKVASGRRRPVGAAVGSPTGSCPERRSEVATIGSAWENTSELRRSGG